MPRRPSNTSAPNIASRKCSKRCGQNGLAPWNPTISLAPEDRLRAPKRASAYEKKPGASAVPCVSGNCEKPSCFVRSGRDGGSFAPVESSSSRAEGPPPPPVIAHSVGWAPLPSVPPTICMREGPWPDEGTGVGRKRSSCEGCDKAIFPIKSSGYIFIPDANLAKMAG